MHFELFLCLGWTGLCWKRRHHFVQWNKNLKEMEEKSRQNFTENSRFIEILLFLQNLRPKSRQFFCLMQRFCCWDGTELDLLEASEVHESCEVKNAIQYPLKTMMILKRPFVYFWAQKPHQYTRIWHILPGTLSVVPICRKTVKSLVWSGQISRTI